MSNVSAAPRAAVPISNARAEASRRNGARSRGPKTPEGKTHSARNALKHGMRAQKYVVLPEEDAAEFAALEAALVEELAPQGVLQSILARRVAIAAWRLMRADRMEVEVLECRAYGGASPGLALIRDGNGTRSVETLLRYRGAATAELMRSLRTLKALQADASREPNEPEAHGNPGESGSTAPPLPEPFSAPHIRPNEPEPEPADRLERLQREVEEAIRAAERGGACGAFDHMPASGHRCDRRRPPGRLAPALDG